MIAPPGWRRSTDYDPAVRLLIHTTPGADVAAAVTPLVAHLSPPRPELPDVLVAVVPDADATDVVRRLLLIDGVVDVEPDTFATT